MGMRAHVASDKLGQVLVDTYMVESWKGEKAFFRGVSALPAGPKEAKVLVTWDTWEWEDQEAGTFEYYASVFGITVTVMTEAQEEKLRYLCERYGVEFDPEHYRLWPSNASMTPGWAEGWVGGKPGTLYVGVDPDGSSHS